MNEVVNDTSMDNVTPKQDKKLKEYHEERIKDEDNKNRVVSPVAGNVLDEG